MHPHDRGGAAPASGSNADDGEFTMVPNRVLMDLWAAISEIRTAVLFSASANVPDTAHDA